MLNLVDETLHQMPLFVTVFVVLTLFLAISSWWNNCFSSLFSNKLQNLVSIIRFVGQNTFIIISVHQGFSLSTVMPLTRSQNEAQRVAQGINANMDFGAKSATAATQRLFSLSSVFLKHQRHTDEPAQRCYPKSGFPYLGHQQSAGACFARFPCHTSGRNVCRRCSSYHISQVTPATEPQCA